MNRRPGLGLSHDIKGSTWVVFDRRVVPGGSTSKGHRKNPSLRVDLHVQNWLVLRQRRARSQLIPAAQSKAAGPLSLLSTMAARFQ